jgi:hypothetical protein
VSTETQEAINPLQCALSETAVRAAGALLVWMLTVYSVSLLSLSTGNGIWRHAATACLLVIPLWAFLSDGTRSAKALWQGLSAIVIAGLFLVFAYQFAGSFIDSSWDGTAYHQQAILQLIEGWSQFPAPLDPQVMYQSPLNHYPKAHWVIAASIYQAGSDLESAKLLHLLLAACAFLVLFGALARIPRFPSWAAILVAAAAALNPVVIYQSMSFYVDGLLSSLLSISIGLIVLLLVDAKRAHLLLLLTTLILIINTKLTGVAFAGILAGNFLLLLFRNQRLRFLGSTAAITAAFTLGLLLFGFNPFVTNTLEKGHPFYPVLGGPSPDFIAGQRPPGFNDRSGVNRLVRSSFSIPTMAIDEPENLKLPFTFTEEQNRQVFRGADIRLGGWGVLFSGALVLSLLALPLLLFTPASARSTGLIILGGIVVSVLINPEAWWARFAPQWYLVALVPAALLLMARKWPVRLLGGFIAAVMLINSFLIAQAYFPQQRTYTADLKEFLGLVESVKMPIIVYLGDFPSNRIRLQDAGIPFRVVDEQDQLPCRAPHDIFAYEGLFCVEGER